MHPNAAPRQPDITWRETVMQKFSILILLALVLTAFPLTASALPELFDGEGDPEFIDLGSDILCLDYLGVWNNGVFEDAADYPYGKLWLIIYEPYNYEDMDEMEEEDWDRRDEIQRIELPGPSTRQRWRNDDEFTFLNCGIHVWSEHHFSRVVFRIFVEEPTPEWEVDTLMWGTIYEDDSYAPIEFNNDELWAYFRTTDLPEPDLMAGGMISDIWFEHNVYNLEMDGLEIHIEFDVYDMRAETGRIAAFVHYDIDDKAVECMIDDNDWSTPDGNLTVQMDFVPLFPRTTFNDFALFIPYEAFPESREYIDYYVDIEILDGEWEFIVDASSPVFEVRQSSKY